MTVSCRALGPDFDENRSAGRFNPNSSWNGPLLTFRPRRAGPRASKGPILAVLENPLFAYNFFLLWVAEKFVKDKTRAKNNFYNKIFRIFGKREQIWHFLIFTFGRSIKSVNTHFYAWWHHMWYDLMMLCCYKSPEVIICDQLGPDTWKAHM